MTMPLVIQVRKEARALLPWWLGVAAATTATAMLARRNAGFPHFRNDQELWVVIVHVLGVLAVAALSIGHELTHGTLSSLLVQPVSRVRVLSMKLLVLIPAAVALGMLGDWFFLDRYLPGTAAARPLLVWGPVVAAIGLVPLLTVLTRKPLGGVVFAIAIPGLILVASERFYSLRQSPHALTITWYGTLIVSALGALVLFRQFPRLQTAGDGASASSAVPTTRERLAASAGAMRTVAARRHWIWLLVKKDLRLQPLTLAVSGLYLLVAVMVMVVQRLDPSYVGPTVGAVSVLHGVFIALLAGSFSSAEERHLGTLASGILLPMAAWRQWSIKVAVTVGLALALAIGLPCSDAHPSAIGRFIRSGDRPAILLIVAARCTCLPVVEQSLGAPGDLPAADSPLWSQG
jgi:hypothetical protein